MGLDLSYFFYNFVPIFGRVFAVLREVPYQRIKINEIEKSAKFFVMHRTKFENVTYILVLEWFRLLK